ncbi:MAG: efflux RND transporter periplasmic adaptor subunit [Desulfobulbaceae bacterium]|nr:efflux RND transporter periplasmic adaptor subunit [Desulfobulbaceae bacterium]
MKKWQDCTDVKVDKFGRGLPLVLGVLLLLVVVLGFLVKHNKTLLLEKQAHAMVKERPPVNVVVLRVSVKKIRDMVRLPGMIEPWVDLNLLAKISGEVIEVPISEGEQVQEGQLLALVDERDYQIAVNEAEVVLRKAQADYERAVSLHQKGVTANAELEIYRSGFDLAKAAMDKAKLFYSRCRITAPFTGVIRKLHIKKGSYLSVGDPVGKILSIDPVKAVIGIPESDVSAVRDLKHADLEIKALDDFRVTGRVSMVSVSPENMALLYDMQLRLNNPNYKILPGMFVQAEIVKKEVSGISVPLYTIISRNDEHYVYVVEEGVAKRRDVETGILQGLMVQITKGLFPGDLVVVEGHRHLNEGHAVKVFRELSGGEVSAQ